MQAVNGLIQQSIDTSDADSSSEKAGNDEWNGFEESTRVDREDEYVDEDRYTTVTVEAVDVTRDGLRKVDSVDEESLEESTHSSQGVEPTMKEDQSSEGGKTKRVWTKENPNKGKKKRKRFRYESKQERKVTRLKERAGNRSKAKARRQTG